MGVKELNSGCDGPSVKANITIGWVNSKNIIKTK
jgi:hypothetical protein